MKRYFPSSLVLIFLFGLCLIHLVSNLTWISLSTSPLPWDQAGHTRLTLQFAEYFKSFGFLRIIDYFTISNYYPPLVHTIVSIPVVFVGHVVQVSEIVITLFFILSIILVYIYSFELFENEEAALLASIFYSFFPIVYEHSRWMILEIPLICFVLLTLIFLKKARFFMDKRNTMYFFLFLSFAMLTKWLTIFYVAVPLSIAFFQWFKLPKEHKKKTYDPLIKGICLFLALVLPWYLLNASTLFPDARTNLSPESSDPSQIFSFINFRFYIYLFINFQTTLYGAILAIGSFIYFFRSKHKYKLFFALYLGFIYLAFTFIPNKDWRYTMPILPITAIIIGLSLSHLKQKFPIGGLIIILTFISIVFTYYTSLSFRLPIRHDVQKAINLPIIGWIDYVNINDDLAHKFHNENWHQEEILKTVNQGVKVSILNLVDIERFNSGNLLLERDILGLSNVNVEPPPSKTFTSGYEIMTYMGSFQYVLIARDELGNPATRNIDSYRQIKEALENGVVKYKVIKTYSLPNNDKLMLYEKIR